MPGFIEKLTSRFSYDALNPRGRRRSVSRKVRREDFHTRGDKHRGLQANAAELCRNLSLAGWMVRRHLDYVSQFAFHGRNENENLNAQIEALMAEDSRPSRSDVAGRFQREKLFRLAEARRVLDGDTFLIKLNDGRLQGLQADLVRDPPNMSPGDKENWINGVRINRVGRPLAYAVHRRQGYNSESYVKRISATNAIHYGFFDRYASDQVRGVSPLVSSLNPLRDVYENFDYALAKAKVSQLFALSFSRDAADSAGEVTETTSGYDVDFGSGPVMLDLDPGDTAQFLESRQPSSEFQDFTQLVIQVALKSLDLPFSFFDESHTNFFGSRAAWLHYERSCKDKRDDQVEMRRAYTVWKLIQWQRDGRLRLPADMPLFAVQWEWVPRGMPWWDPSKEINGQIQAIKAGLDTPQRICRATGTDYYDNIGEIEKALAFASDKGVRVEFAGEDEPEIENDSEEH